MTDMWKFRTPPVPLDRNLILEMPVDDTPTFRSRVGEKDHVKSLLQPHVHGVLKDQRALTLCDNVLLFDSRNVVVENERFYMLTGLMMIQCPAPRSSFKTRDPVGL